MPYVTLMVLLGMLMASCSSQPERAADGQDPASINAALGLKYLQRGNNDLALVKLKKAIAEDPDMGSAHHYLAALYRRIGDDELANHEYRRALALLPNDALLQGDYAIYLCEQRQYRDAEVAFLATIALYHGRRRYRVLEQAALCALKSGNDVLAERHFNEVLTSAPKSAYALFEMAKLMLKSAQYLKARGYFQGFEAAHVQTAETLSVGIQIEQALGNQSGVDVYRAQMSLISSGDGQ